MRIFASVCLAALVGLTPLGAMAQTPSLRPGMDLTGTMDQTLSSTSAFVGEAFKLSNVTSTGTDAIANATIYGHVSSVTKAAMGRNARVQLAFDRLQLYNGASYALDARPLHIKVVTKSNAPREGIGAVVGDLLGNWAGQSIGLALLGPIGLVGGYLIAKNARQNVTIPQNSLVTLQVVNSHRQA